MKRNQQRRNRLLILAGGCLVLGLGVGGVLIGRRWKIEADARAARDAGHVAFAAGEMERALDRLGTYLGRFGKTEASAEDWLRYGKARQAVPMPNRGEWVGAIAAYRRALDLDPSSKDARDSLLRGYAHIGRHTEALDLIDRSLAATPDDMEMLRTKADLLELLRRFPDALTVARTISDRADAGREDLLRTNRLLIRTEAGDAAIDAWIESMARARPGDPFLDLLRAGALSAHGEHEKAAKLLDAALASQSGGQDPELLPYLVQALDGATRFSDALMLLRKIETTDDEGLRRQILRRLWCGGLTDEVAERTGPWTSDPKAADAEVLATRALALLTLGRPDEAAPLAAELASRTDANGRAWSEYVELTRRPEPEAPRKFAEAMSRCVAAVPGHPVLLQALGDASMTLGEWDAAVRAWFASAAAAPAWASPLVKLSRAHRALGRKAAALRLAEAACLRAPGSGEAVAALIEAQGASVARLPPAERARYLERLEAFDKAEPQAVDLTLPVRVELIAQADREKATALLRQALDAPAPLREESLLRLAVVAAGLDAPLADALLDRSEKTHGTTPRLALTRAVVRHRASGPENALRDFEAAQSKAGGTDAEWGVTRAQLLEALGRPESAAEWAKLADAHPESLRVQLGAAASSALWTDREAVGRVVERLHALTGDSAVTWRLARVRLVLTNQAATEADVAEASAVAGAVVGDAPENVSARMLFAHALEKSGDAQQAAEQLESALRLEPDSVLISLELARLAQLRGDTGAAKSRLESALGAKGLSTEHAERAAFLLAAQGDLGRSAGILERLTKEPGADREGQLLLATIYAKQGRNDEALQLCEGVLDPPTVAVVELAAGLYAAAGRPGDAAAALARLDTAGIAATDAALARGRHAARWESGAAATGHFRRAVDAAPDRRDAWSALLLHSIATGDRAEFARVLDDPRARDLDAVKYLRSIRELCDAALADSGLRLLLRSAAEEPSARDLVTEALRIIARDWPDTSKRAEAAQSVRALAERNVKCLALQLLAADLCVQSGDLKTSTELARKTAAAAPNSSAALRQWAELLFVGARFEEALAAGRIWRDRAPPHDLVPDGFLARVFLRLGRPKDAAATLEPHAAAIVARPDANETLVLLYAAALSRSGERLRTTELLSSLAARSERWRTLPLGVGPEWMGTGAESEAWLQACAAAVPADDVRARLLLVQSWGAAWEKFRTPALEEGTKAVLAALTARKDAPADAHFLAGTFAQQRGDAEAAGAAYAAALKANSAHHAARNNLAMVLADSGRWEEAVTEAETIVRAAPKSAEFLDTLAYAYRKGRKFGEAKTRLAEAIALQPLNPAWRVSLAETLAEADDANGLAVVLSEIRRMEESGAPLAPDLRARMERFRKKQ